MRSSLLFASMLALALSACRSSDRPLPPPPGASLDSALAAPAAPQASAPEPAPTGTAGDAYFSQIAPHFDRVSIYKGPEVFLEEYARTPEKERNLLAAHWCASEISNGGFMQLFSGAAGVLAPEAVTGLEAMGLAENAAVVKEAIALFGKQYPREMKARHKLLDRKRRPRQDSPFGPLDQRFFEALRRHPGGFDGVAASYARKS